jgi:hypothetical protein
LDQKQDLLLIFYGIKVNAWPFIRDLALPDNEYTINIVYLSFKVKFFLTIMPISLLTIFISSIILRAFIELICSLHNDHQKDLT